MAVRLSPYRRIVGVGWGAGGIHGWRFTMDLGPGVSGSASFGGVSIAGAAGTSGITIDGFVLTVPEFLEQFPPPVDPEAPYELPFSGEIQRTVQNSGAIFFSGVDANGEFVEVLPGASPPIGLIQVTTTEAFTTNFSARVIMDATASFVAEVADIAGNAIVSVFSTGSD